jgi:hypothetical protein
MNNEELVLVKTKRYWGLSGKIKKAVVEPTTATAAIQMRISDQ